MAKPPLTATATVFTLPLFAACAESPTDAQDSIDHIVSVTGGKVRGRVANGGEVRVWEGIP